MLNWLYNLLGTLLYWFSSITGGSYALALLLYALVFKILFLPFSIKQQKNQIKMAKLTPKIELIKAKYKGRTDRPTTQKMQQEIMELQRKIEQSRQFDEVSKQKRDKLKSTAELLEEVLSESRISDANLRMLVNLVVVHQNEDKSIDVRFEFNGDFEDSVVVM